MINLAGYIADSLVPYMKFFELTSTPWVTKTKESLHFGRLFEKSVLWVSGAGS